MRWARHRTGCRKRALAGGDAHAQIDVELPIRAKVFLLTDHKCFSSCLIATHDFRALGAVHVGETTDANTSYAEVRAAVLPSGLAAASTLIQGRLRSGRSFRQANSTEISPTRPHWSTGSHDSSQSHPQRQRNRDQPTPSSRSIWRPSSAVATWQEPLCIQPRIR